MARLCLVRHGKSEVGFDEALNSDLSPRGMEQAQTAALTLAQELSPRRILSSPLIRALRTAEPLAKIWGHPIEAIDELTEIPTPYRPEVDNLKWRRAWLDEIMKQHYGNLAPEIEAWRKKLEAFLSSQTEDAMIFTHYLTINAAIGLALNDDRVVVCDPGYCTIVPLDIRLGKIYVPDGYQAAQIQQ